MGEISDDVLSRSCFLGYGRYVENVTRMKKSGVKGTTPRLRDRFIETVKHETRPNFTDAGYFFLLNTLCNKKNKYCYALRWFIQ
jgi:hypothetical protein